MGEIPANQFLKKRGRGRGRGLGDVTNPFPPTRKFLRAKKTKLEPVPATHCPKCREERRSKGYKHGKELWCDECHEHWVRGGCGAYDEPKLGSAIRRRPRHRHMGDVD